MGPSVVYAVKLGASSPIWSAILYLLSINLDYDDIAIAN